MKLDETPKTDLPQNEPSLPVGNTDAAASYAVPVDDAQIEEPSAQTAVSPARSRRKTIVRELIETVLIVAVVFLGVRFLVQNFVVEGDSMLPTLRSDQYLLVNKAAYLFGKPERGDIVVFRSPNDSKDFIKRVIALEGETVEIRRDFDAVGKPGAPCGECGVYVNGVRLDEPYIKATANYSVEPVVVPPGYVYLLGDNRRNSTDSHVIGAQPVSSIVGKAFICYWPLNMFGFLPHYTYSAQVQPNP